MDFFKNNILTIDQVFNLLKKPRDINEAEFELLLFFMGMGGNINSFNKHLITSDNAYESFIQSSIAESKSDVRRFMKGGSLMIGKKQITNIDQKITEKDFFETGIAHIRWCSIKHGKKRMEFAFIMDDSNGWFDDISEK